MAIRKRNLRLSAEDLISIAGDLGTQARIFNDNEVRQLLRGAVQRAGTQVAFAKRHGLDRTHLNQVLKGRSRISTSVLKCLGLCKAYTVDPAANLGRTAEAHSRTPALEQFNAGRSITRAVTEGTDDISAKRNKVS
jgi:hypothetical protein